MLAVGIGLVSVDVAGVTVALTDIGKDFDLSSTDLAWIANVYLIAFAGLLLVAGRVGDLIGRRSMFVTGLGVFTVASGVCGLASTGEMLAVGRLSQAVGGAMIGAVTLGMMTALFDDRRRRVRATAVYATIAAGAGAVGLLGGGIITDLVGWRWVFAFDVAVAVGALALAKNGVPRDLRRGRVLDVNGTGALVATAGLMAVVYGTLTASAERWSAVGAWIWFGSGVVALTYFVWREKQSTTPLIPRVVWQQRARRKANVVLFLVVSVFTGWLFLGLLYLRTVLAYNATAAGLALLPLGVSYSCLALFVSAKSLGAAPLRVRLYLGHALLGGGLMAFSFAGVHASYIYNVLPAMMLIGLGWGLLGPSLLAVAMEGTTDSDAGITSAIVNTTLQLAGGLGIALFTAVAAARTGELERAGYAATDALVEGYQRAYVWGAVTMGVAGVAAVRLVRTREGRPERYGA